MAFADISKWIRYRRHCTFGDCCRDLSKGDCVSVCYYTDTIGLDSDVCQIGLEKTIKRTADEHVYRIVCDPPFKLNDIQNQSEINVAIKLLKTKSMNKNQLRSI
eukprot:105449_1